MYGNKRHLVFIGIIVCILVGTALGLKTADTRAKNSAAERAETVLLDSAREQEKTFAATLGGRFQVLKSLSATLTMTGETDPAAIEAELNGIADDAALSFSEVSLVFADGMKATAETGYDVNVSDRAYFQKAMAGEKAMAFNIAERETGRACIALAVPYWRNGEIAGVVRGLYYEEDLRELLVSQAYGGAGYSLLVDSAGEIIVNTETRSTFVSGGNMLSTLGDAQFTGESLEEALASGHSSDGGAALHYTLEGARKVAALVPLTEVTLPENDWFVLNIVNESQLSEEIRKSRESSFEAMAIFAAFAVLALGLLIVMERDYRKKQQMEDELTRQRAEQFRIVTEQSGKFVMRYDISTRTVRRNETGDDGFGGMKSFCDPAETAIRDGYIDAVSADDYRAFFEKIDAGESPVVAEIMMCLLNGCRRWYKHVSTTIFDDEGCAKTAIISYYDDTDQRERALAYAKWQQELESIPYESTALYEWNLTRDVDEGQRGALANDYGGRDASSFNARTALFAAEHVLEADRPAFIAMMNREHLIALYFSKVYQKSLDYRYTDASGGVLWRRISVQLVPYPDSENIKAYVTNQDIDAEKREELAAVARAEQDFLTGALNRETFINRVRELLIGAPASAHALLMLDVDGFKLINDTLGHEVGDRVLSDFVRYTRTVLRASDIIGRIGGDEFMVCLPDMPFDAAIAKKAGQLCAALRRRLDENLTLSVSVGIAVYPRDGADFDELYRSADAALYDAKRHGKDGYAFYQKGLVSTLETTEIDARPASPAEGGVKRAVLAASDAEETLTALSAMLAPEYELVPVREATDPMALVGCGTAVNAAILDMDTRAGRRMLDAYGQRLADAGVVLYAIASSPSEEARLHSIRAGIALFFEKPVKRDLLLLRLNILYAARDLEQGRFERDYRRLQTAEEMRYREVLNATGTTVIVYDTQTKTYGIDRLSNPITAGSFAGHSLGDEMVRLGILSAEDVAALAASVRAVGAGAQQRASHTVRMMRRDGERHWFKIQIIQMENREAQTPKLLLTVNDVNEQVELDEALLMRAERDALTGLYNRETFFEKAADLIAAREPGYYVMACFDIDNFKVVNDQYGTAKGDDVLKTIAHIFDEGFSAIGGICCRVMADNFAVLYPSFFMEAGEVVAMRQRARVLDGTIQPITFSIGRYIVDDPTLSVSAMYDRASIAETSVKGRFDTSIALFDESMREHILKEQEIINEMNTALTGKQFEVWFQPQYNHSTGAMVGSEALVRWRHPRKGLIPPVKFLPVFERNGFVYEMDKYVWRYVAATLRLWNAEGRAPLPVSVNVSRYDVYQPDFFSVITGIVERYAIPPSQLRLEITESAFAESSEQIISVVKRLIDYGFTIEIDDFGSGYSSLNTLKDVPADILKLDMRFLEDTGNSQRSGNILESIVRMAKWLGMPVIAEGVETVAQADYLVSIGCNYMQGYLYARPMTADEFAALAKKSGKEREMIVLETVETLDNDAFWDPTSMETLIFNSYVGGACVFEYHDGVTEILRANKKYAEALGGEGMSVDEAISADLRSHMGGDDLGTLYDCIQRAVETGREESCEVRFFGLARERAYTYIRATLRVIARTGERRLLYCAIIDVTAQREAELKLREASEQTRTIMENVNGGVSAVMIEKDGSVHFVMANEKYYSMFGYTKRQFERELSDAFELVHPDDRDRIKRTVERVIEERALATYEYRCIMRDGGVIHVRCNASITRMEGVGERVLLSVITDITELVAAEEQLAVNSQRMQAIMENVNGGVTAVVLHDGAPRYLFANDRYYEQLGYTRAEFEAEVRDVFDLIYPADRAEVVERTQKASVTREPFTCVYRVTRRDGSMVRLQSNISIASFPGIDEPVQLAVANDVTEQWAAEQAVLGSAQQLRFLNDIAKRLLADVNPEDAIRGLLERVLAYFHGDRAYVFEFDDAAGTLSNTYEVCAEGVTAEQAGLQRLPRDMVNFWLHAFDKRNHIVIEDVDDIDESRVVEKQTLKWQGIRSLVAVPVRRDGRLVGFMGVDDPAAQRSHAGSLEALGDYVAVILTRRDLNARIESDNKNLLALMNDTPGGFARLSIRPDGTVETVYVNDGYCKLFGVTRETALADGGDAMEAIHPEDRARVQSALVSLLASGTTESIRYRLKMGDGGYRNLVVFGRVTRDEAGAPFLNVYYTNPPEGAEG